MKHSQSVPIRNIYHMLCYAWNELDDSGQVLSGSNEFDHIYNLYGRVYLTGVRNIVKRGLNRYYKEEAEALSALRGKLQLTESIKNQTVMNRRVICEYDEFSEDILINRIVKATLHLLLRKPGVDQVLKNQLKKASYAFSNVSDISLYPGLFKRMRFNRQNRPYRMLLHISELIVNQSMPDESLGVYSFADFIKDRQMAKLYEKFLLNFYKHHLPKGHYKVYSPRINWKLDDEVSSEDQRLLPRMQTDVVVENEIMQSQLIIDAKYYSETLSTGYLSQTGKLRSGHMYQLMTYMNHSLYEGEIQGMLLYPAVHQDVSAKYSILGNTISIETLNLADDWRRIEQHLLDLIN